MFQNLLNLQNMFEPRYVRYTKVAIHEAVPPRKLVKHAGAIRVSLTGLAASRQVQREHSHDRDEAKENQMPGHAIEKFTNREAE